MTDHRDECAPATAEEWAAFRAWRLATFPAPEKPPAIPRREFTPGPVPADFIERGPARSLEAWLLRRLDEHHTEIMEELKAMLEKAHDDEEAARPATKTEVEEAVATTLVNVLARLKQQEGKRK